MVRQKRDESREVVSGSVLSARQKSPHSEQLQEGCLIRRGVQKRNPTPITLLLSGVRSTQVHVAEGVSEMTDTIRCAVKSHPLKYRGQVWLQRANGDWTPVVTCRACDPYDGTVIAELTEGQANAFDPAFPPKPPVTATLI